MDGAHPWRTCHPTELGQCGLGLADGQLDPREKAIGVLLVRRDRRVVDQPRQARGVGRADPLPRHPTVQREHVHRDAVLVHPLLQRLQALQPLGGWQG